MSETGACWKDSVAVGHEHIVCLSAELKLLDCTVESTVVVLKDTLVSFVLEFKVDVFKVFVKKGGKKRVVFVSVDFAGTCGKSL